VLFVLFRERLSVGRPRGWMRPLNFVQLKRSSVFSDIIPLARGPTAKGGNSVNKEVFSIYASHEVLKNVSKILNI
jgi:hypothetical protein